MKMDLELTYIDTQKNALSKNKGCSDSNITQGIPMDQKALWSCVIGNKGKDRSTDKLNVFLCAVRDYG